MKSKTLLLPLSALCLASACSLRTRSDPPRLQGNGIVDGHLALGIAAEDRIIQASLFSGSLAELVLWKLFRIEVGFAGASLTLGPLHMGIGTLAYYPDVPRMQSSSEQKHSKTQHRAKSSEKDSPPREDWGVDDCDACEAARIK